MGTGARLGSGTRKRSLVARARRQWRLRVPAAVVGKASLLASLLFLVRHEERTEPLRPHLAWHLHTSKGFRCDFLKHNYPQTYRSSKQLQAPDQSLFHLVRASCTNAAFDWLCQEPTAIGTPVRVIIYKGGLRADRWWLLPTVLAFSIVFTFFWVLPSPGGHLTLVAPWRPSRLSS